MFKEVLSRGYFDVDFRSGEIVLVAGRFIGLIPLNEGVVVEILPKIPLTDFVHILEIAGEDPGSLQFFERAYLERHGVDRFFPLIAKSLLQQLRSLAQEGILKEYCRKAELSTFKPTIQFSKTMQRVWSRGNFSHSYSEVFDFTKDTAFNRLIKYALWFCGRHLASGRQGQELGAEIEFYTNLFETVALDLRLKFIPEVESAVRSLRIPVLRNYYLGITKTCLLIARNSSVIPDSSGADLQLLSFIINLEDVFEKYVRNLLRTQASGSRKDILVRNGNLEGRGYLFHDSRISEVRPDIVIVRGQEKCAVVDVKYKPRTADADRYQIISHASALGAKLAIFVLPASETVRGLLRKGQVHDANGIQVFEYHMPLEGDLAREEERMSAAILGLVPV